MQCFVCTHASLFVQMYAQVLRLFGAELLAETPHWLHSNALCHHVWESGVPQGLSVDVSARDDLIPSPSLSPANLTSQEYCYVQIKEEEECA